MSTSAVQPAAARQRDPLAWAEARARRILLALSVAALAAFLATLPLPRVDGLLIGSDGIGYYMYVRSLFIDGDLDFSNEYARLNPQMGAPPARTAAGLPANPYAAGPGLLWMPFFAAAHALAALLASLQLPVSTDGYGRLYQAAVCAGSIVYGCAGMFLLHAAARRSYPRSALAACVAAWLGTGFVYYQVIEPSMSHMCSFFAVSLLVYLWLRWRNDATALRLLGIGLAGGLVALVRQPDAALFLVPAADLLLARAPLGERARRGFCLGAGFLLVFSIQMVIWKVLNGGWLQSGYLSQPDFGFHWLAPRWLAVWFSTRHGLFLWHPVTLFAAAGLLLMLRRDRRLGLFLLAGFLVQTYIIAAWAVWWQGDAFGGRMFIASLPVLALGLAELLAALRTQRAMWAGLLLGAALVAWNALFMLQYRLGFISMSGPYALRELLWGKVVMLRALLERLR